MIPIGGHTPDGSSASIRILGLAETFEEGAAIDADDPIVAARTVRRALAGAGRRAVEVEVMVIFTTEPASAEQARRFARRALGPIGTSIPTLCLTGTDVLAETLALEAVDALKSVEAGVATEDIVSREDWQVAVAVGFGPEGRCVALCLGRGPGTRRPRQGSTAQRACHQTDESATQQQRHGPDSA